MSDREGRDEARRASWAIGAAVTGVLLLLYASTSQILYNDSFMTLTLGRSILEDGLPYIDQLTRVGRGRAWIDQQWLAHVIYYGLHHAGGYPLLLGVAYAAPASAFGLLAGALTRRGAPAALLSVAALLSGVVVATNVFLRAELLAYPLAAAVLLLVTGQGTPATSGLLRRRAGSWQPAVVAAVLLLWGNVHGSVLLGVGIVLMRALVVAVATRGVARQEVAGWAVASIAGFVTPYGRDITNYYRGVLASDSVSRFASEWWGVLGPPVRVLPLVLLAAVVLFLVARHSQTPLLPGLIAVFTGGAMWFQVRHQAWFALAAVLLVGETERRGPDRWPAAISHRGTAWHRPVLALGVVSVLLAAFVLVRTPDSHLERAAPRSVVDQAASLLGPGDVVLADPPFSAALLWWHPELAGRVAFDGRLELFAPEELEPWVVFDDAPEEVALDELPEHQLLVWRSTAVAEYLSEDGTAWEVLHREDDIVIATPR